MGLARKAAAALSILLTCAVASGAHEIGTTRVSISVRGDGAYEVEIVTDAASLADKLLAASDRRDIQAVRRDPVAALPALAGTFSERVHIAFDGIEGHPDVAVTIARPGAGAPEIATVHLAGKAAAAARQLTWSYDWTFASYALTVESRGARSTIWLEGGQISAPIALAAAAPRRSALHTIAQYLLLGFTHILPGGLDHVLFVLGIYLLNGRIRSVLSQVSAFTVAHSITLGLGMYGLVAVPSRVVEPLIALSIAYVAIENLLVTELKVWRVALVFAFGLLHGLGFAGALRDVGLPRSEFLPALVAFNAGVEAAQLAVISAAFLLVGWYCSRHLWYRTRVVIPASLLIAWTAVYWTIQRLTTG